MDRPGAQGELHHLVRRHDDHVLGHVLETPALAFADWHRASGVACPAPARAWLVLASPWRRLGAGRCHSSWIGAWHHVASMIPPGRSLRRHRWFPSAERVARRCRRSDHARDRRLRAGHSDSRRRADRVGHAVDPCSPGSRSKASIPSTRCSPGSDRRIGLAVYLTRRRRPPDGLSRVRRRLGAVPAHPRRCPADARRRRARSSARERPPRRAGSLTRRCPVRLSPARLPGS